MKFTFLPSGRSLAKPVLLTPEQKQSGISFASFREGITPIDLILLILSD
jgi:hypothetical protein